MKQRDLLKRAWVLPMLGILFVAQGIVLYHLFSRMTLTVAVGLALLVLLKHVGVFGPIYALFKRRSRH